MTGQDETTEEYITLTQATKICPGGRVHVSTIYRWCCGKKDRHGQLTHLRHIKVGRKIYTRREWLYDFFEELALGDIACNDRSVVGKRLRTSRVRHSSNRNKSIEWAENELDKAKI